MPFAGPQVWDVRRVHRVIRSPCGADEGTEQPSRPLSLLLSTVTPPTSVSPTTRPPAAYREKNAVVCMPMDMPTPTSGTYVQQNGGSPGRRLQFTLIHHSAYHAATSASVTPTAPARKTCTS